MNLTPELMVRDIESSIVFYTLLGFTVETMFPEDQPVYAQMGHDQAKIMLYTEPAFRSEMPHLPKPIGGTIALYVEVADITAVFLKISRKYRVVQKLRQTDYGTKECAVLDPNGYTVILSEKVTS